VRFDRTNTSESLAPCVEHLKRGGLVAFPTETVYGLGAHALDASAVLSIFEAKGRPLTDPVIVHVLDRQSALPLIQFDGSAAVETVFEHLATEFWPGPLTLVLRANPQLVPDCVTASTGFVGIRAPKHAVARLLLEASNGMPIAAPSANRFGHVSPTRAQHVFEDLCTQDCKHEILVLDGDHEEPC
jgi:L-threonylcarbamoyladenylate synthase